MNELEPSHCFSDPLCPECKRPIAWDPTPGTENLYERIFLAYLSGAAASPTARSAKANVDLAFYAADYALKVRCERLRRRRQVKESP